MKVAEADKAALVWTLGESLHKSLLDLRRVTALLRFFRGS